MSFQRITTLCCALAISGCAQLPPPASSAAPKLSAEQTLQRVLDFARDNTRVADLNAERLRKIFGVPFETAGTNIGYGEKVAPNWWSAIQLLTAPPNGPRLDVSFHPDPPSSNPAMTEICKLDYDRLAAELKAMGFKHQTYRAEHRRVIQENFERPGMTLWVYTQGEADEPREKITHACVRMILIH